MKLGCWEVKMSIKQEIEEGTMETVSEQPEVGVLFKSHNNRTWAPSLTEDLKFNLEVL